MTVLEEILVILEAFGSLLGGLGGVLEAILGVLEVVMIQDSTKIAQEPKQVPKTFKKTMDFQLFGPP